MLRSAQAAADRTQLWHARLAHPSERQYVLLAERDDGLAGFVCVLLDEEPTWGACLDNLHVRPDLTGHGLGRALLAAAARWLRSVEPTWPLHLWVFEANAGARRFYERTGAELVEHSRKMMPDGEAHVVLRCVWRDLAPLAGNAIQ
jgi:GNAT superfamily N-acetyltransferase